jgi:hypothetical protein
MTTLGGLGHTAPYLVPDSWANAFWIATAIAGIVVFFEIWAIACIRARYMDTPFLQAVFQIVLGGAIVLAVGILIGAAYEPHTRCHRREAGDPVRSGWHIGFNRSHLGVLDRPVKPGDDTDLLALPDEPHPHINRDQTAVAAFGQTAHHPPTTRAEKRRGQIGMEFQERGRAVGRIDHEEGLRGRAHAGRDRPHRTARRQDQRGLRARFRSRTSLRRARRTPDWRAASASRCSACP